MSIFSCLSQQHNPTAVVCHYTPKEFVIKEDYSFEFSLDLSSLKFSWLRKSSSCYNRARNVYFPENDFKRMKKMIIHSFRYLYLAKQLLCNPKTNMLDFSCANDVYYEIMSEISTDWKYYDDKYNKRREELSFQAFPKELQLNTFIKDEENFSLSALLRSIQFPGTFEGQTKYHLLDIIRNNKMTEEEVLSKIPSFHSQYIEILNDYTNLCYEIQGTYDQIRLKHLEFWSDSSQTKEIATKITEHFQQFPDKLRIQSIIFYMKNKKIENIRDIFVSEEKLKFLRDIIFNLHNNK